jgi:CheY-like chemotaxis protein/anti-sigma regulatory factor (Ser/Thr protein kinase)
VPEVGKRRILVVDDDGPTRALLGKIISKIKEYEVCSAVDGIEALELFERQGPFDLVITDLQMPRLDGEELVSRLLERWPQTAILVITAHRSDESVVRCLGRGALDYLTKPIEVARLIRAVDRAFDRREHLPRDLGAIDVRSALHGWVELTAPSHFEYVERFQRFTEQLYSTALGREEREDIHMAINEIGQNAVEWGNRQDSSKRIRLSYCLFKDRVVFKIEDEGEGFAVAKLKDPSRDPLAHIMDRISAGKRMGGYGIFMTKSIMDEVVYSERGNVVVMTKFFHPRQKDASKPPAPPAGAPPGGGK